MELGAGTYGKVFLVDGSAHKVFTDNRRYSKEKRFLVKYKIKNACKLHTFYDTTKTLVFDHVPNVLEDLINCNKINRYRILVQLAEFLLDAKAKGVVHGDFKAKNVMVMDDLETIKVIDFDNARKSGNNADDIKKFKFIVIQLIFNMSYKDSYTNYHTSVIKLNDVGVMFFGTTIIEDMMDYLPNIKLI